MNSGTIHLSRHLGNGCYPFLMLAARYYPTSDSKKGCYPSLLLAKGYIPICTHQAGVLPMPKTQAWVLTPLQLANLGATPPQLASLGATPPQLASVGAYPTPTCKLGCLPHPNLQAWVQLYQPYWSCQSGTRTCYECVPTQRACRGASASVAPRPVVQTQAQTPRHGTPSGLRPRCGPCGWHSTTTQISLPRPPSLHEDQTLAALPGLLQHQHRTALALIVPDGQLQ